MQRFLSGTGLACATTAVVLVAAVLVGPAAAASSIPKAAAVHGSVAAPSAPPVYYEGQQINLAQGEGASLDCVIYLTRGDCFDTIAEMKTNEASVAANPATPDGAAHPGNSLFGSTVLPSLSFSPLLPTCSTPLSVWKDEGYQGTEKDFAAEGVWRNMTDYGINDAISSFIVGACGSHLAENTYGGGYWYPCDTSAGAHHREMDLDDNNGGPPCPAQSTSWNDRVSSTWVN